MFLNIRRLKAQAQAEAERAALLARSEVLEKKHEVELEEAQFQATIKA